MHGAAFHRAAERSAHAGASLKQCGRRGSGS
jgi:hypothetical protein